MSRFKVKPCHEWSVLHHSHVMHTNIIKNRNRQEHYHNSYHPVSFQQTSSRMVWKCSIYMDVDVLYISYLYDMSCNNQNGTPKQQNLFVYYTLLKLQHLSKQLYSSSSSTSFPPSSLSLSPFSSCDTCKELDCTWNTAM